MLREFIAGAADAVKVGVEFWARVHNVERVVVVVCLGDEAEEVLILCRSTSQGNDTAAAT